KRDLPERDLCRRSASRRPCRLFYLVQIEPYPGRGMVACTRLAAYPGVDAGVDQSLGQGWIEQQMVDPQTGVAFPVLAKIVPERVDRLVRVPGAHRIEPALREQAPIAFP